MPNDRTNSRIFVYLLIIECFWWFEILSPSLRPLVVKERGESVCKYVSVSNYSELRSAGEVSAILAARSSEAQVASLLRSLEEHLLELLVVGEFTLSDHIAPSLAVL